MVVHMHHGQYLTLYLSYFGFDCLSYAVTMQGQTVQWMIARSQKNANIYLIFKGASNPIDGMIDIGLHPLRVSEYECSVFSGMYAALQDTMDVIIGKLNTFCGNNNTNNSTKLIVGGHSLGGGYTLPFVCIHNNIDKDL